MRDVRANARTAWHRRVAHRQPGCPGLADTISEDRGNEDAPRSEVGSRGPERSTWRTRRACLACTHYGYRKDLFTAAFDKPGYAPSPRSNGAPSTICSGCTEPRSRRRCQFVTRYAIPAATVERSPSSERHLAAHRRRDAKFSTCRTCSDAARKSLTPVTLVCSCDGRPARGHQSPCVESLSRLRAEPIFKA
jgi:hypothetical protein